jgi:hypothetical protein
MTSPRSRDKSAYTQDPLYHEIGRLRRRELRKRIKNDRKRRKWATDPEFRERERARRYGLSLQEFRALLAQQANACAICRKSAQRLCLDHCHSTGKVRGFLCRKCNLGLGCYDDDPNLTAAATAYLKAARGSGIGHNPLSLDQGTDCATTDDGRASPFRRMG